MLAHRLVREPLLVAIVLAALVGDARSSRAGDPLPVHVIEFGTGAFTPLDTDLAGDYGAAPSFTLGYAPLLTTRGTRLILDIGAVRSRGKITRNDPTFDAEEATYWLLPVRLGVRTDLTPDPHPGPVRFSVGAAFEWITTWWRAPFQDWSSAPAPGIVFEARPDFHVSQKLGVWTRARFAFRSDVQYDEPRSTFEYSGSEFQVGLSYAPR
ncbi:MAG: hypothetical protein ACKVU1_15185 [bacterium]